MFAHEMKDNFNDNVWPLKAKDDINFNQEGGRLETSRIQLSTSIENSPHYKPRSFLLNI